MTGLYVHIPFCVKKCAYCDFFSHPPTEGERESYAEALLREIKNTDPEGRSVTSVFFGGGTPSLMGPDLMGRILEALFRRFEIRDDAEISLEANPGTVDLKSLRAFRAMGFSRISLGIQSLEDAELKALGRIHGRKDALEALKAAAAAGFENINADIMTAIPGQSLQSLERTLREVVGTGVQHISCYSLILEEGTPFYERYPGGSGLPDEDTSVLMDELVRRLLGEVGYGRYEISNYARPGYECRHNLGYWKRTEYLGFGAAAASLIYKRDGRYRFTAERDITAYQRDAHLPLRERREASEAMRRLTTAEEMEEFMFLGLRCTGGVLAGDFRGFFGRDIFDIYGDVINSAKEEGLMGYEASSGRIFLTERGLEVSNRVMANFLVE